MNRGSSEKRSYSTQAAQGRTVCSWVLVQTVPLFEQLCCNAVIFPNTLEAPRPCQLEVKQVRVKTTGCKSTLKKSKRKGKGKHPHQKGTRTKNTSDTVINTCKNCGRKGHWVKDCWSVRQQQQDQQERQRERQTVGRGANESAFRNTFNSFVSFTDTEHDRSSLVQSRRATERLDQDPGRSDNQFPVFHKETSWCRVFAS